MHHDIFWWPTQTWDSYQHRPGDEQQDTRDEEPETADGCRAEQFFRSGPVVVLAMTVSGASYPQYQRHQQGDLGHPYPQHDQEEPFDPPVDFPKSGG